MTSSLQERGKHRPEFSPGLKQDYLRHTGQGSSFRGGPGVNSTTDNKELSSMSRGSLNSGIMGIGGLARRRQSRLAAQENAEIKKI